MRILLHVCCGPCTVYPLRRLRDRGYAVTGFFHNPNIHPFLEFRRRLDGVGRFADLTGCPMEIDDRYGLTDYLRRVVFHEDQRCEHCYAMRLERTAAMAAAGCYDAFSTTLLYSKYQNHPRLIELGERLATEHGVGWLYEDFRAGWQEGIDESIRMGLYRQPYCGCLYSEQERYDKKLRTGGR